MSARSRRRSPVSRRFSDCAPCARVGFWCRRCRIRRPAHPRPWPGPPRSPRIRHQRPSRPLSCLLRPGPSHDTTLATTALTVCSLFRSDASRVPRGRNCGERCRRSCVGVATLTRSGAAGTWLPDTGWCWACQRHGDHTTWTDESPIFVDTLGCVFMSRRPTAALNKGQGRNPGDTFQRTRRSSNC